VGSDASMYLNLILDNPNLEQQMSPFIVFIGKLVNYLNGGSFLFFLIISLFINSIMFYTFYKIDSKNYILYMAIYSTSFLFINSNINLLRQGMAISIGFLAIYFLVSAQIKRYFIFVFISIFIHSSAVILLIPFFLLKFKNKFYIILFITIIVCLYMFHISIIDLLYYIHDIHWTLDRLYWYLTWDKIIEFKIKHVYYLYILLIAIYLYKFNYLDLKLKNYFLSFLSVLVIIILFRNDDFVVDRFSFYFIPIAVVLYLNLYKLFNIRNKFYLFIFILFPFLWIGKSLYQFNLWWILKEMR